MPNVVGTSYDVARIRLEAQPLKAVVVYKPASPGQALHVVVKQIPARGRLSSYSKVTIVFAKPLHGVIPRVVGLTLPEARKQLARLKLVPVDPRLGHGRLPAEPARSDRRRARPEGQALGTPRLKKAEPRSTYRQGNS